MQQEKHDVGIDRVAVESHGGGIVGEVFDLVVEPGELGAGVHEFVFDDIRNQDPGRAALQRRPDDLGDYVAEGAGRDQHAPARERLPPESRDQVADHAAILEQQDRRDDRLVVDEPDQTHVRVNRIDVRPALARRRRAGPRQQRAPGKREKEQRDRRRQHAGGDDSVQE